MNTSLGVISCDFTEHCVELRIAGSVHCSVHVVRMASRSQPAAVEASGVMYSIINQYAARKLHEQRN